jgi:hypothetical protein
MSVEDIQRQVHAGGAEFEKVRASRIPTQWERLPIAEASSLLAQANLAITGLHSQVTMLMQIARYADDKARSGQVDFTNASKGTRSADMIDLVTAAGSATEHTANIRRTADGMELTMSRIADHLLSALEEMDNLQGAYGQVEQEKSVVAIATLPHQITDLANRYIAEH